MYSALSYPLTMCLCNLLVQCFLYLSCIKSYTVSEPRNSQPIVTVEQGALAGLSYTLPYSGKTVYAFRGIPYAAPPVFKNRFKPPLPAEPWIGVYNATTFGSPCVQYFDDDVVGEDDCLFLNIYTPQLPHLGLSRLMDVVFNIHGGAFMLFSGDDSRPDLLINRTNTILVTMNYRLGVVGFFSTGDDVVPGNNGLKDQVAALRWVQRNIVKFGGNPSKITIAGLSAGGASVNYHLLSPLSAGLFHRAISFSGTVFPPWTLPAEVPTKSYRLASLVGCPTSDSARMVNCLEMRPAHQIAAATKYFYGWRGNPISPFGPVIEPEHEGAFLTKHPLQILMNGKVQDVPWISNVVTGEGLCPVGGFVNQDNALEELNENWVDIAPQLLDFDYVQDMTRKGNISHAIRRFYFQDKDIDKKTVQILIKISSDRFFFIPQRYATRYFAAAASSAVYMYKFNYRGKYSLTNILAHDFENYGVSHGDDIQYFLNQSWGPKEGTAEDMAVADFMVNMLAGFMKTGKPFVSDVAWSPVEADKLNCLQIYSDKEQKSASCEEQDVDQFWKSILPEDYAFIKD